MKILIPAAFASIFLLSCDDSQRRKDAQTVEDQQEQYASAQPIPRFDFSLERDVASQLYKARNENVTTWTVWRSDLGHVEGDCPSVGYPIPYDTSLTNPLKIIYSQGAAVEQAEPNGLFPSKNSTATWVRCISEVNGKQVESPIYIESKVTTYPYPVTVDYDTSRVKPVKGKEPSVTIKSAKKPDKPERP